MNRVLLGIIALALLLVSGAMFAWGEESLTPYAASLVRIGVLLGVIWLAVPDLRSPRSQLFLGLILVSAAVAILIPRAWPLVLAAFVLLAILRPRRQRA
jgi:hypothetical protein